DAVSFTNIEHVEINVDGPDSVIVGSDLAAAGIESITIHAGIDSDFIDVSALSGGTTFSDPGTGDDEVILGGAADTVHFTSGSDSFANAADTVINFDAGFDTFEFDSTGVGFVGVTDFDFI